MAPIPQRLGFGINVASGGTDSTIGSANGIVKNIREISHTGHERGEVDMTTLSSTGYREYHQNLRTLGKYEFSVMYASTDSRIHEMMGAAFNDATLLSRDTAPYVVAISPTLAGGGGITLSGSSDVWYGTGDILSVSPAFPRDDMIEFSFVFNLRWEDSSAILTEPSSSIGLARPTTGA